MWSWLKRKLWRNVETDRAERRISDAICQASDHVFHSGAAFFAPGLDDSGMDRRLRARVEIVAYFLHWTSRTMHAAHRLEDFEASTQKVLVALRSYLARDHFKELRDFGLSEFELYFLETLGEREADYAFQFVESDEPAELFAALATRLSDHLTPAMAIDFRFDNEAHEQIVRASLDMMLRGWAERLGL